MKALLIGVPIWGALIFVLFACCRAAGNADEHAERLYRANLAEEFDERPYSEWVH